MKALLIIAAIVVVAALAWPLVKSIWGALVMLTTGEGWQ
jgi:hypothetical protein